MNCATEKGPDLPHKTHSFELSPTNQNGAAAIQYLIVVRRKNKIVKVFRPQEKHLTIGRSSKCSITLSDPRFSRTAGEIIIGPVPILRRNGNRLKNSDFISIQGGKRYRLQQYTISLLEPDKVIFNPNITNNGKRMLIFWSSLFLIIFVTGRSSISHFQNVSEQIVVMKRPNHLTSVINENGQHKKVIISKNNSIHESIKEQASEQSLTLNYSHSLVHEKTYDKPTLGISGNRAAAELVPQNRMLKKSNLNKYREEFDNAIKRAASFIEHEDLEMGGRVLNPLIPHADKQQLQTIIDTIDPLIQHLFKEAYMLKPYEPEKSKKILLDIVNSGLEILPSYVKAKKSLESEPSSWTTR